MEDLLPSMPIHTAVVVTVVNGERQGDLEIMLVSMRIIVLTNKGRMPVFEGK
jgi:hypothetical protein